MTHVALFDYGAGNLHSLKKGIEAGGARVTVTTNWDEALDRDALVLPGVGSFGAAVQGLGEQGPRVRRALEDGLPCLGICLGMQLLFPSSEEAEGAGIGFLPGRVRRLRARTVPQIGWNDVVTSSDPLLEGVGDALTAYYANSFVCDVESDSEDQVVVARSEYEGDEFAAAVRKGRTWGFQFHPEKSSLPGLRILSNFILEVNT